MCIIFAELFSEYVAPIQISNHKTPIGTEVTVIGWGKKENGSPSSDLMEVKTRVMSHADAQPWFNDSLTDVNIVTGLKGRNESSCDVRE